MSHLGLKAMAVYQILVIPLKITTMKKLNYLLQ